LAALSMCISLLLLFNKAILNNGRIAQTHN
jgi:hypothetical protein